jgi:hypothetical protein
VIDPRVENQSGVAVTARFVNVPLDVAVRLLADMADLGVVRIGNVFYATSPENAKRLQSEQSKSPPATK